LYKRLGSFAFVQRLLRKLAPSTREKLRRLVSRRIEIDESKFRLTPQQRDFVIEQLRPDLQRLQAEYGVDVESRWGISIAEGAHQESAGRRRPGGRYFRRNDRRPVFREPGEDTGKDG
jgi:hypothetical protein